MTPLLPRRFSIRTMLASVAIVAGTIVVTRDYVRVQSAREHFNWLWAAWQAGRVLPETVVAGSFTLMDAEGSALWISNRAAGSWHVARLQSILEIVESPLSESQPDDIRRRAAFIREEIQRYDPEAAGDQVESHNG